MTSPQEKKYLRLIKFSLDLSLKVSRAFTSSNVLCNFSNSFAFFLTSNQHDIYHLWIPNIKCCCCTGTTPLQSKQLLLKPQFDKMFNIAGHPNHGHFKKDKSNKNKVVQHCICDITVNPTCTLEKLDIVILCKVIRNCFKLQPDEHLWLGTISKIRNELAHVEDISNFENGTLENWWTQLEGSVLGLSRKVPPDLYYHEAIKGQVSLLQIGDFDSTDVLDELKTENAKLMAGMKDEMNNLYVTHESFGTLQQAVISRNHETESHLSQIRNAQEAAASQASSIQKMILKENNNMKEIQERQESQFQVLAESQSEIKREIHEFKGGMSCRVDKLEVMLQAILQKQTILSPDAADNVGRTHDVGCQADGRDIDYDKVITELQNEEPVHDEANNFNINSARTGSILLDLTCSPEVLKNETNLRNAIHNLIKRIVKAGNIDTSAPNTMTIELTFKGPLTEEEARVLSSVFTTNEGNPGGIDLQKKTGGSPAEKDESVAPSVDKPLQNMVYCKHCSECFVCENCNLKDRQISDLTEKKSEGKITEYDYETEPKDRKLYSAQNSYIDWMKLHLENLQKEEKILERDVANCESLLRGILEDMDKDRKSGIVKSTEKDTMLHGLNKRYSDICTQLETKSQQVKYHLMSLDEYISKQIDKGHDHSEEIDISIKKGHHSGYFESKVEKVHDHTEEVDISNIKDTMMVNLRSRKWADPSDRELEDFDRTDSEEDSKSCYRCTVCGMVLGDEHSYWCNECSESLCENCHAVHQKTKATSNHQTIHKLADNMSYKLDKSFIIEAVHITDMKVLGSNLLVIADRDHNQILTYRLSGHQQRRIAVRGKPNRLAVVNDDQVAVTLPHDDKISIIDVRRGNVVKNICVKGVYWAIAYYGGEIYVSCDSFKIKILDLNGRVTGLVRVNGFIPSNLCLTTDGKLFCIDNAGNKLVCIDIMGNVLLSFSTPYTKGLWSLAIEKEGHIIVTDNSQYIHRVNTDGRELGSIVDTCVSSTSSCVDIVAAANTIVLAEHDGHISIYKHI